MRYTITLIFALLFLVGCASAPAEPTPTPEAGPAEDSFPAPDFTLTALDGTSYTLSELRGKWVLINWWATWCGPCVTEMPYLQRIADERAEQMVVLGVNLSESREQVEAFANENGISFPLLLSPSDTTVIDYNVIGLPQTLLVNPDGDIVARQFGALIPQTFESTLDALLGG
jgi:thiol-disulfide isomerase/thioredoxin